MPELTPTLISEARQTARDSARSIPAVLAERLSLEATECIASLGAYLQMPVLSMAQLFACEADFTQWDFVQASQYRSVVLKLEGTTWGVVSDPFDVSLQLRMETRAATSLCWAIATHADIDAFIRVQEENLRAMAPFDAQASGDAAEVIRNDDLSIARIAEDTSPVIRLVNSTLYDALKLGVSDIHFEAGGKGLSIKFRIDGVLSMANTVAGAALADQIISRIKVMAELDIGERRIPQDGRFKLAIQGREIDFRVSIMPSLFGEDAVIRVLDKKALTDQFQALRLDLLGFDSRVLEQVRKLSSEPYGMVLVTGPTGSGKTTTLYAAISEIQTGEDKIVTIEDPIEYHLPGTLQIPVNEKKGLSFARGLRSILRHDPDKILVGEIRDPETAQIAIQSALTGHLVFTSVHANNVLDVIGRFLHMGIDPYSFVSSLNGVLAQRLLRVVCEQCAEPISVPEEKLARSAIALEQIASMRLMKGKGCGACRGSGYHGRVAIGEVLMLNDEIRELIASRAPVSAIKQAARRHGTRFLREAAVELLAQGRTTLEEINRVTFAE